MTTVLMDITAHSSSLPYSMILAVVGIVGFLAAVSIGSIAWYNSKRPAGWEDKERPNFIPKIDKK